MAHIRQEGALGAAGFFSGVLGLQQFLLRLFSINDFFFELGGAGLQLIVGAAQGCVALLDFRQHGVEAINQAANFIAVGLGGAHFIIPVRGNHAHGVFQVQNRPGNQPLQLGRHKQGKQAGDQHKNAQNPGVAPRSNAPLTHVRLQEKRAQAFAAEGYIVKYL